MADPMDLFAAIAEGLATCSALVGERPVTAIGDVDVTDELLTNPDVGLGRMEWALTEIRARVASGQATSDFVIENEDIERVKRLKALIVTGPQSEVRDAASECLKWWARIIGV
jgi:hypothetical protein